MKKPDDKDMLGSEYLHEVTNVTRIFGRQHDISVVVEGNMAGVDRDGNIIYPSIAADSRLTPEEISISRGYVDHECGHKRHTDLPAFFAYGDKCRSKGEELKLGIANAMEDPRMEAKVIDDYEGSHENLTAVANSVCQSWRDEHGATAFSLHQQGETHEHWYQFVGGALSILGRHECWGFDTHEYTSTIGTFQRLMGEERMAQCREFSKRLAKLTSTKQVLTLADEVGEWIRKEFKQDQQQQQQQQAQQQGAQGGQNQQSQQQQGQSGQGQGQGMSQAGQSQAGNDQSQDSDGSGDSSDGSGDGDSDGSGDQDQGSSDKDQDQTSSSADDGDGSGEGPSQSGRPDQQGTGQSNQQPNGQGNPDPQGTGQIGNGGDPLAPQGNRVEVGQALQKALEGKLKGMNQAQYRPFSTRFDSWHTRKDKKKSAIRECLNNEAGHERYKDMLNKSAGKLNVIRRKLERALQSDRSIHWDGGQQYGRLDSRRLVAAFNRQEKVFKRKQDAPAHDTAVTFLLDLSYSMNGAPIETSIQTLICLAEALEKTSIQYNILGHTIGRHSGNRNKMRKAMTEQANQSGSPYRFAHQFARNMPLDMFEFKSFNERLGMAKKMLGNVPQLITDGDKWNGNVDHEALWHSYKLLSKRPEGRHVLIVLSDGMPNPCSIMGCRALAQESLKKTVKEIEGRGVEVIGIGIQEDDGAELYQKWHTVWNLDELAETVIDELGATLMGKHLGKSARIQGV